MDTNKEGGKTNIQNGGRHIRPRKKRNRGRRNKQGSNSGATGQVTQSNSSDYPPVARPGQKNPVRQTSAKTVPTHPPGLRGKQIGLFYKNKKKQQEAEQNDKKDQLKEVPVLTSEHYLEVTSLVEKIASEHSLTAGELSDRQLALDQITEVLNEHYPGSKMRMYGSCLTEFGLCASDLNLHLEVPAQTTVPVDIKHVSEYLKAAGYEHAEPKSSMTRECVSLVSPVGHVTCHISIGSDYPDLTSRYLHLYAIMDPRVQKLAVIFRYWAQVCGLFDAECITLPSICYDLMVIYYLQRVTPPVLPVLWQTTQDSETKLLQKLESCACSKPFETRNNSGLGQLWLEMLHFYTASCDLGQTVICVNSEDTVTLQQLQWTTYMAVQDPFRKQDNLIQSTHKRMIVYLKNCLLKSLCYFAKIDISKAKDVTNSAKAPSKKGDKPASQDIVKPNTPSVEDDKVTENGTIHSSIIEEVPVSQNGTQTECVCCETGQSDSSMSDDCSVLPCDNDICDLEAINISTPDAEEEEGSCRQKKASTNDIPKFEFEAKYLADPMGPAKVCGRCERMGHTQANCPVPELTIKPLPAMDPAFLELLTSVIENIPNDFALTEADVTKREHIRRHIEMIFQQIDPGISVKLFGSSTNGFGFQFSDVDMCAVMNTNNYELNEKKLFGKMIKKLWQYHHMYTDIVFIKWAKIPLLKFDHSQSGLACDLSINNLVALHNTQLVQTYCCIDERMRTLGYAIKVFAKVCNIGNAAEGSLSSYTYILLMIHYLQHTQPPVLPVLQQLPHVSVSAEGYDVGFYSDLKQLPKVWPDYGQNRQSVGDLWLGFFLYYLEEFNLDKDVVSIRQWSLITKAEKSWSGHCMAVEDPFITDRNLSKRHFTMDHHIREVFVRGRQHFGTPVVSIPPQFSTVADYFFDAELLIKGPQEKRKSKKKNADKPKKTEDMSKQEKDEDKKMSKSNCNSNPVPSTQDTTVQET